MKDNRIELADVVRQFKDNYLAQFGPLMMPSQKKALTDISACMTGQMGGHQYRCRDCHHTFWVYHGCRDRACPACHGRRMREWLEARQAELLPCDYYHVVATVPEELRHLFLSDQKLMYSLLMKTVAGAVIDLARDPKYLGATPAILMVLHTWTGQLHYHPHAHLLVTGGGVSDDGQSWCEPPGQFLIPVKALSKLIAARFRDALKKADPQAFDRLPRKTWKREWCSFCKHYGRGRRAVLDYLARYAFRIAITNTRMVAMDDTHVTFKYKQRETGEWRLCRLRIRARITCSFGTAVILSAAKNLAVIAGEILRCAQDDDKENGQVISARILTGVEFLRRFLMHVLAKGFHKLRYYGLWHHAKRPLQHRARVLLSLLGSVRLAECLMIADITAEANRLSEGKDTPVEGFSPSCPHCGSRRVRHLQERRRGPAP